MRNDPKKTPMKRKRTIAVVSTSAMAAGMAHGAVYYTQQNIVFPLPSVPSSTPFDVNGDTIYDFFIGFDGINSANAQKPYVGGYPTGPAPNTAVLARLSSQSGQFGPWEAGLPVTSFGAMIDASYLTPVLTNSSKAYLDQDGNANYVGDWPSGVRTEGYVGVEFFDGGAGVTNFAWLHLIYDGTAAPVTLTLVDSGYEETPGVGIVAGSTNEVGAPIIYSEPASQTVAVGANVQLEVVVLASPAPAYQWKARGVGSGVFTNLSDGGVISGTTTATLNINGVSSANMLDYIVVITNGLGATTSSPPATLTVVSPTVTPNPQVLFGGVTAQFNVTVAGGLSPTYRWRKNGANLSDTLRIVGSTTAQLQVSNLQSTDAANYDVVLTMGSLSVTSAVSRLTVLPVEGESTYETALLAAGPVAYYRLDETGDPSTNNLLAYDNVGGFNGVYGTNVSNGFAGVAGPSAADGFPGFASNNTAASIVPYETYSWIPVAPWNLNTNTATMLAWVNPADQQYKQAAVVFSGNNSAMSAGINYYYQYNPATLNFDVGYVWEDITSASYFDDTGLFPPIGQWSMVAVTVTPRNAIVYLFNTNGVSSATNDGTVVSPPFDPFTNQVMAFATSEYIGTDYGDTSGARNFDGAIDEVAVFKKALSQDQLQTIFNAALGILPPVELQLTHAGSNIQLTWPLGRLLEATSVKGPWTTNSLAVSPYTVTPTGGAEFYRVLVH
jgi:hypothetical protein